MTTEMAELYDDLDHGFRPINFLLPWAPLPQNRRRDMAHEKMRAIYMDIIKERRKRITADPSYKDKIEPDMIWNLMDCVYKSGTGQPIPDSEIANMMITILMAGQHSSSSASAWIMLELAAHPKMAEEVYQEQLRNVVDANGNLRPLEHSDLDKCPLLQNVVKETLRVHSSIHTIMRKVKNPIPVPNHPDGLVITPDKVLLASPIVTHMSEEYFPDASKWDPHRWETYNPSTDGIDAAEDTVDYGYGAVSKGTKSPYLPFGAGRHRCIGEKFAYVNLCTIVATLVREFRFGRDYKSAGLDRLVPETDYTSLFSRPKAPALIRWERREKKAL